MAAISKLAATSLWNISLLGHDLLRPRALPGLIAQDVDCVEHQLSNGRAVGHFQLVFNDRICITGLRSGTFRVTVLPSAESVIDLILTVSWPSLLVEAL